MKHISSYKKFFEAISGTELVGKHMGPNYPTNDIPVTIKQKDIDVIYSDLFGRVVTYDEYQNMYFDYLKRGGKPLQGFNIDNIETVMSSNESRDYDSFVPDKSYIEIQESFEEIFVDYLTDYSMKAYYNPGYHIPEFHGFMSYYTWIEIKDKVKKKIDKNYSKCVKICLLNEHWGSNRVGQEEIYIDNDSQYKFSNCIKMFENILSYELDDFVRIIYPKELWEKSWQIVIEVLYN